MKSTRQSIVWQKPFHFTTTQRDVLTALAHEGMTGAHLDAWIPNTKEEHTQTQQVGSETWVFDKRFTIEHGRAVIFLVRQQHLAPLAAIKQIDSLSAEEADLLVQFYTHGLTGDFIRQNRDNYSFSARPFAAAFKFIRSRNSFLHAAQETMGLSAIELELLQDFYDLGLRGEHLRHDHEIAKSCHQYHVFRSIAQTSHHARKHKYQDAVDYVRMLVSFSLKQGANIVSALNQAVAELLLVSGNVAAEIENDMAGVLHHDSKRLNFLRHHVKHGIRASDTDKVITAEQLKTFYVLKLIHKLTPLEAIRQVRGLSDDKVVFLRQHYSEYVNHHTLSVFPHHAEFINHRMKYYNRSAEEAMKELKVLSPNQLVYYHQLESIGVTYDMVSAIKPDAPYSQTRVDTAVYLVNERNLSPDKALEDVLESTEADLKEMMCSNRLSRSQIII